ncbi:hypothetical protein ERX37_05810 [Macrococcus hajekii]|uniref:Uncharacterized protein n=1 Tax=Macrococcus hajekii TaxID=198482 RepID=A0A4R6BJA5_9STAP|nr:hypothetical protein [Macrococcus hajekii]TDM01727.1 hypothetical protein ERX37_05810 [Macrococcus hajekii]GGB06887.1 hypothetical protein GCM10007190_13690 [Macrococcus hajekii]
MKDKSIWISIVTVMWVQAIFNWFDKDTAKLIVMTLVNLFISYKILNILFNMRKQLEEAPLDGKFLMSREKDIYLYHFRNFLILFGINLIVLGIVIFSLPWNWIVADLGVIALIIAYLIESFTYGYSDILKWEE